MQVRPSRSNDRSSCEPVFSAPGQNPDRIVATVAVARKFNSLGADQDVHAGAIERRAESIGVQRLAPLVVRLLVAMAAVGGIGKGAGSRKSPPSAAALPGSEILSFAKGKLYVSRILSAYALRAIGLLRACLILCAADRLQAQDGSSRQMPVIKDDARVGRRHSYAARLEENRPVY